MFSELDSEISKEDILNAIKHLKSGKSSGPDHMHNDIFIFGKNEMINCVYAIFNKVFQIVGLRVLLYLYIKKGVLINLTIIEVSLY